MSSLTFDTTTPVTRSRSALRALLATDRLTTLTLIRVGLGIVILPHGLQKTIGWFGGYGFSGTMDYFTTGIGIPALFAFLAIAAESAGALGLITGLFTRIAAVGVGSVMLVAAFTHKANGFFMNWTGAQAGEGFEFHILAIAMAVALLIGGGGRFSLDRALSSRDR